MDIPVAVCWALLAFAGLNLLLALRALNLLRRAGRGHRAGPALDAVDHMLGTVLIGAIALPGDHAVLAEVTLILLGPVILWKGIRDFRARREEKAKAAADAAARTDTEEARTDTETGRTPA